MIRNIKVIFCDNEHGLGTVCFPPIDNLSSHEIEQEFVKEDTAASLRKAAKEQGWGRVNGGDYCPTCMESM
jgi:hypothetical protein